MFVADRAAILATVVVYRLRDNQHRSLAVFQLLRVLVPLKTTYRVNGNIIIT